MDELTTFPHPVDPGLYAWFSSLSVLAQRPGKLLELQGRSFVVTRPWPDLGLRSSNSRPVLLPWQVGTRGQVFGLQFSGCEWRVLAVMDDKDQRRYADLCFEEAYPEIPLQLFLRCTAALEPHTPALLSEAANDH